MPRGRSIWNYLLRHGVTLRKGDREYFYAALDKHFPGMHEKYHRRFGYDYEIPSEHSGELMRYFRSFCKENHIVSDVERIFAYLREFPENKGYEQLSLF